MPTKTTWVDKPNSYLFEGALLVLNIGNNNYKSLPQEYLESLQDATRTAHASNWAVLWLFDPEEGVSPPPEEFEIFEDSDFPRLADKVLGVPKLMFPFMPVERDCYIRGLILSMSDPLGQFFIDDKIRPKFFVIGQCHIGKEKVLLPLTEVEF